MREQKKAEAHSSLSIVIEPADRARKHAVLSIHDGSLVKSSVAVKGDSSEVVAAALTAAERNKTKVFRVWQHGDGELIALALEKVISHKVLRLR